MSYCETCRDFYYNLLSDAPHRCAPEHKYLIVENGGDWDTASSVHAYHADTAARKAAEMDDDDGGEGPSEKTILIKDPGGTITKWSITFDYSVDYSAHEVTE